MDIPDGTNGNSLIVAFSFFRFTGWFLFPYFFSAVLFLKYFFDSHCFSAAQTHNTSTTVTSAPPTARGQFSKDWQLINMVLTRRWDGARGLPTFISFSYDLEVRPRRVTSRRERIVRSVWGRRISRRRFFSFLTNWRLSFFSRTQVPQCYMQSRRNNALTENAQRRGVEGEVSF